MVELTKEELEQELIKMKDNIQLLVQNLPRCMKEEHEDGSIAIRKSPDIVQFSMDIAKYIARLERENALLKEKLSEGTSPEVDTNQ